MKQPWLIQRCKVSERGIDADFMGYAEFRLRMLNKSLERLFSDELCEDTKVVTVGDEEIMVFMIAKFGFVFDEYQPYLQQLADNSLRLKDPACFDCVLRTDPNSPPDPTMHWSKINAWWDIENDVFWTLTKANQTLLVTKLTAIKKTLREQEKRS